MNIKADLTTRRDEHVRRVPLQVISSCCMWLMEMKTRSFACKYNNKVLSVSLTESFISQSAVLLGGRFVNGKHMAYQHLSAIKLLVLHT